jgi:hypothetical protein
MITDRTVFILGAGASKPYGFPTALELRKDIITKFSDSYSKKLAEYKSPGGRQVAMEPGMRELIDQFNLSATKSIDLFLSRNKKYYDFGKEIIAFLIAEYEIKSKFLESVDNPYQDWYFEMFDLLTKEIANPEKLVNLIGLNKVSFITFNYDRSLEHFLYTSFYNSFATKRNELKQIMPMFKFIHLYGKLAPLPWENLSPGYKYADESYFEHLDDFVENIKIIFEERAGGMDDAKNEILAAQKIFFLGFGYADENLAVLEFSSLLNEDQWIYGTAMGSTEVERRKIASKLKGSNQRIPPQKIVIQDCDSVMLLRNHIG